MRAYLNKRIAFFCIVYRAYLWVATPPSNIYSITPKWIYLSFCDQQMNIVDEDFEEEARAVIDRFGFRNWQNGTTQKLCHSQLFLLLKNVSSHSPRRRIFSRRSPQRKVICSNALEWFYMNVPYPTHTSCGIIHTYTYIQSYIQIYLYVYAYMCVYLPTHIYV